MAWWEWPVLAVPGPREASNGGQSGGGLSKENGGTSGRRTPRCYRPAPETPRPPGSLPSGGTRSPGQAHGERGAYLGGGLDLDPAPMGLHDGLHDVEAQAHAAARRVDLRRAPRQGLKKGREQFGGDGRALIVHGQRDFAVHSERLHLNGGVIGAVLERVGDEVLHHLREPVRIPGASAISRPAHPQLTGRVGRFDLVHHATRQFVQVRRPPFNADAAPQARLGEIQEVLHHADGPLGRVLDAHHALAAALVQILAPGHGGGAQMDGPQRAPQVMAHDANEVLLELRLTLERGLHAALHRDVLKERDVAVRLAIHVPVGIEGHLHIPRAPETIGHSVLLEGEALAGEASLHVGPQHRIGRFPDDLPDGTPDQGFTWVAEPVLIGLVGKTVALLRRHQGDEDRNRIRHLTQLGFTRLDLSGQGLRALTGLHLLGDVKAEDEDAVHLAPGVPQRLVNEIDAYLLQLAAALPVEACEGFVPNVRRARTVDAVQERHEPLRYHLWQRFGDGQAHQLSPGADEPLVGRVDHLHHVLGPLQQREKGGGVLEDAEQPVARCFHLSQQPLTLIGRLLQSGDVGHRAQRTRRRSLLALVLGEPCHQRLAARVMLRDALADGRGEEIGEDTHLGERHRQEALFHEIHDDAAQEVIRSDERLQTTAHAMPLEAVLARSQTWLRHGAPAQTEDQLAQHALNLTVHIGAGVRFERELILNLPGPAPHEQRQLRLDQLRERTHGPSPISASGNGTQLLPGRPRLRTTQLLLAGRRHHRRPPYSPRPDMAIARAAPCPPACQDSATQGTAQFPGGPPTVHQ
ncbi:hypothetical protein STIAU_4065 [Stigmatella aurantiaca DW4/3-1]|uniref:Uncharacterized protein n=1 Tax=Stigmatella aurantiaca (strain DW4/3-1) TaxID=378806 RepID=Q08R06_STIAD|nr:hypothetical protein STIAU_4065 [Stigmatella aurantiaca DW4/3-1]